MRPKRPFNEMRISGLLSSGGPLLFVILRWVAPDASLNVPVALACGLSLSGVIVPGWAVLGRLVATASIGGAAAFMAPSLLRSPATALAVGSVLLWLLGTLWLVPGLPRIARISTSDTEHRGRLARLRVSLRMTAMLAIAVSLSRAGTPIPSRMAVLAALAISLLWAMRARPLPLGRPWQIGGGVLILGYVVSEIWKIENVGSSTTVLVLSLTMFAATLVRRTGSGEVVSPNWWERFLENPSRQLVTTFTLLIVLGTFLLGLPLASSTAEPVPFIDAAFTAVSAVCVTGLIVLDTARDWSLSGQILILVLIQLGGLGIMTFATAFMSALGRRLSLRQEGTVAEMVSQEDRLQLYSSIRRVLGFTFVLEFAGTVTLSSLFYISGDSLGSACWRGVFTAISSFCNAGFALQSDNLVGYANNLGVLHVVAILIILGGLSPAVVVATARRRRALRLQAKLVLATTALLLVVGALLFGASEWNNTLSGLGTWAKLNNAWFQSVTLRTAGFNSVDFSTLNPATATFSILWMFVGGSPGGTAGGIKTTTFAVLLLSVLATVRGHREVSAFGHSISRRAVYRATSVATLGTIWVIFVLLAIQLTQNIAPLKAFFEVMSASGTVGLSMGATTALDSVGKIIIMIAMFAGRVGSLTVLVFLIARSSHDYWQLPEGSIDLG